MEKKQLALQVGCSLYEFDDIAEKFLRKMDIIQLPISVYDQRPQKSGFLKRLKDMGICIHAQYLSPGSPCSEFREMAKLG